MEAPKEQDKCKHCAANFSQEDDEEEERYLCELCKEALYCSDECEMADFLSHRDSCKWQERVLAMQKRCSVCIERIEDSEVACTECGLIKYCSVACKVADKECHDLICGACARLAPRPSTSHRICILFPAEEDKPRVIWVSTDDRKAMSTVVAPAGCDIEMSGGPRTEYDDKGNDYRQIWFVCVDMYTSRPGLPENQSLAFLTGGRPSKLVRASLLVTVTESIGGHEETQSDVGPADLLPVVRRFAPIVPLRSSGVMKRTRVFDT